MSRPMLDRKTTEQILTILQRPEFWEANLSNLSFDARPEDAIAFVGMVHRIPHLASFITRMLEMHEECNGKSAIVSTLINGIFFGVNAEQVRQVTSAIEETAQ